MSGDGCPICDSRDEITLTSDIYASARGIEAPPLYDAADRALSFALLVEFGLLFMAAAAGSNTLAVMLMTSMMATAGMLAWGLPAMRQRHRLRLVMRARARALPPARWKPELPSSATEVTGVVKRLKKGIRAPISGEDCLVAAVDVVVRDKLAFREIIAEDFLVAPDRGSPVIVAGELWLEPCASDLEMPTAQADLQIGSQVILPARFRPGGIAHETRIHEGDRITVRGRQTLEHHPDLVMSYRDPNVRTLRGQAGAPVSIEKHADLVRKVY
jgi:hypothetical protein